MIQRINQQHNEFKRILDSCVRSFMPKDQGGEGQPFFVVNQIMGCSMGVVVKNYAQMTQRQLQE